MNECTKCKLCKKTGKVLECKCNDDYIVEHYFEDCRPGCPLFDKEDETMKHKREIIVTGEYAQRIIDLTARAEAAEAERDAAIEDLKQHILWNGTACTYCRYCEEAESALSPCDTCEDIPDTKMPTNWEWRGPQEAREGGQDETF